MENFIHITVPALRTQQMLKTRMIIPNKRVIFIKSFHHKIFF